MKYFTSNDIEGNTIFARKGDLIDAPLPWQRMGLSYTASGYGKKIPTAYLIHFDGRKRRIYCTIYSNIGTTWIVYHGHRIYVDAN